MNGLKEFFRIFFVSSPYAKKVIFVGWLLQTINLIKYVSISEVSSEAITAYLLSYVVFLAAFLLPWRRAGQRYAAQIVFTLVFAGVYLFSLQIGKVVEEVFTYDTLLALFLTQNNPVSTLVYGIVVSVLYLYKNQMSTNFVGTVFTAANLLAFSYFFKVIKGERDRYKRVSITDELTRLYNFSYMLQSGQSMMARLNKPIRVLIMDVNGFKQINDTYGHLVGNRVLLYIADKLRKVLSGSNAVAGRFGGDEFMILMEDHKTAVATKQLLNRELKEQPFMLDAEIQLEISISVGEAVSSNQTNQRFEEILHEADFNMYFSKQQRNSIFIEQNKILEHLPNKALHLLEALRDKDMYTYTHSFFVAEFAAKLAQDLNMDSDDIEAIRIAGILHDIGKLMVPNSILHKTGNLTPDEYEVMKQHVMDGLKSLQDIPLTDTTRNAILYHHERWDGRGYPLGTMGTDQPLEGRIIQIADAFSAMTNRRLYRVVVSYQDAIREIRAQAGLQFDPVLVERFIALIEPQLVHQQPEEIGA